MSYKPLILDFIQMREEESSPLMYTYDLHEQLNVVHANGKKVSFIDIDCNSLELNTKTRIRQEADDDRALLEMETKTKVKSESDDYQNTVLEITTKTFTKVERDDEKNINNYQ